MHPTSYDTQAIEVIHMVAFTSATGGLYYICIEGRLGKGIPGKTVYFLHCQLVFYWNVAPKPLSTAVHEIS